MKKKKIENPNCEETNWILRSFSRIICYRSLLLYIPYIQSQVFSLDTMPQKLIIRSLVGPFSNINLKLAISSLKVDIKYITPLEPSGSHLSTLCEPTT